MTNETQIDNKWLTTIRALVYYVTTTLIAVIIGVCVVLVLRPGVGRGDSVNMDNVLNQTTQHKPISTIDTVMDLFRFKFNFYLDFFLEL